MPLVPVSMMFCLSVVNGGSYFSAYILYAEKSPPFALTRRAREKIFFVPIPFCTWTCYNGFALIYKGLMDL